jgi:hypothetical protein
VGGYLRVYSLVRLERLVLGEEELVRVVLCLLGIPCLPGIPQEILLLQEILQDILLVVLPLVVIPIQMEFREGRFFFLLYLGDLLDLVLLLGIGPHHLC